MRELVPSKCSTFANRLGRELRGLAKAKMPRLEEFLEHVAMTGLVEPRELARLRAGVPETPVENAAERLAQVLVDRGALTSYQARKILSGATRGFVLGDYRLLKPLGQGGMGKVFLAVRGRDGKRFAVKVLPPKRATEEENAVARFRREMELSQRVQHPNVARTIDVGHDGDAYFMVMEYIEGESLYDVVKDPRGGPLRVDEAARFFLKVVDGLEAAHEIGVVHRDIKPSNLMLTPNGDAKILDLGLAHAHTDDEPDEVRLTRPNTVIGTLDYASPEQLGDAAVADRRSDLYSLGCTMYFAIAGHAPFEGGDVVNKIFKQRMEDPVPLERVATGVPAAFAAIVRKLMAKPPAERYQTCDELRVDLKRWTDPAAARRAAEKRAPAHSKTAVEHDNDEIPWPDEDDDDDLIAPVVSIRDLGDAEPTPAPIRRNLKTTRAARVVAPLHRTSAGDGAWLYKFIALVLFIGLVVIVVGTFLF